LERGPARVAPLSVITQVKETKGPKRRIYNFTEKQKEREKFINELKETVDYYNSIKKSRERQQKIEEETRRLEEESRIEQEELKKKREEEARAKERDRKLREEAEKLEKEKELKKQHDENTKAYMERLQKDREMREKRDAEIKAKEEEAERKKQAELKEEQEKKKQAEQKAEQERAKAKQEEIKAREDAERRKREEEDELEIRRLVEKTRKEKEAQRKKQMEEFSRQQAEIAKKMSEHEEMKKRWSNYLRGNPSGVSDSGFFENPKARSTPVYTEETRPRSILKTPEPKTVRISTEGTFRVKSPEETEEDSGPELHSETEEPEAESESTPEPEVRKINKQSKYYKPARPFHEEYLYAEPSSGEEDDYRAPSAPVHVSMGFEDPYVNEPLSSAGKVYNRRSAYRELPHKHVPIMETALKDLQSSGCSQEEAKNLITASAAMAQVVSHLAGSHKKQQKRPIQEIPPPDDIDLRINSFNYNVQGNTIYQILGKRFCNLEFPSEVARKMVMREIFEKVASHPLATPKARLIATNQLAQIDPVKEKQCEIQTLLGTSMAEDKDSEIVPPPFLGDNDLDASILKTLQTRIGLGQDRRFKFEELRGSKMKTLLLNLGSVISNARLRESEAYALMLRITEGLLYENIYMAQNEHRVPFEEFWMNLQKTQRKVLSSKEYEEKLQDLLERDYVGDLEQSLSEILVFNSKIHEKEPDPAFRKLLCQRDTLADLRMFIRKHYPSYASQVNTVFMEKLRHTAAARNLPNYTNENIFHPGKSYLYLEVACEVLSQCEPDNLVRRDRRRNKGYALRSHINTITTTVEDKPKEKPKQEKGPKNPDPEPFGFLSPSLPAQNNQQPFRRPKSRSRMGRDPRSQTPGNGRESRFGNGNFRSQTPGGGFQGRPRFACHLCNVPGHRFRRCLTYPGEEPGEKICSKCGGKHNTTCRARTKGGDRTRENSWDKKAQIMALNANPDENQNPNEQRQGPPQNQQYNRYSTPGPQDQNRPFSRGYTPGPYRDQNYRSYTPGPNNYGNQQYGPDQGYRGQTPGPYRNQTPGPYRSYTPGPPNRNQGDYRNDYDGRRSRSFYRRGRNGSRYRGYGRRSQSGYRNNDRYREGDGYRDSYKYRQNNGYVDNRQDRPRMVGHQQILQMEEAAKAQYQQKLQAHSGNQQGLGNDGYQPLSSSVVLSTLEAKDLQYEDSNE